MAKKRRDDTSLSSLLGRKREINIDEIEKATREVHQPKKVAKLPKTPIEKVEVEAQKELVQEDKETKKEKKAPQTEQKPKAKKIKAPKAESADVVRASISTPYELYLMAKRIQRKEEYRSLGAFYLHVIEEYLKKPLQSVGSYEAPDFSDSIDVSVAPELELWMQIKFNQRKLGFKNMAGFYVFCLQRYLQKVK
ncbi:MAG: hypothetical protein AAF696_38615 [Bacteroidota bacterium]